MDRLREGSINYTDQRGRLKNPNQQDKGPRDHVATGDRTDQIPVKQLTLSRALGADMEQSGSNKGSSGILVHGPKSQGPRTLLIMMELP
jgi:hypothetical protein